MAEKREHVVMFPYMAQGHIIPFLALAKKLQKTKNYKITFINTPQNIKKLTSSLPPNSSIHLLEIPFKISDHLQNLPPNTENTDALPYQSIAPLSRSTKKLKPVFKKLIFDLIQNDPDGAKPLCIISDMLFFWAADVAHDFDIFHAIFCVGGGFGFACYYSLWINLPHKDVESVDSSFLMPDFVEGGEIHYTQLSDFQKVADGEDPNSIFIKENFEKWSESDAILANTVEEIDMLGMDYYRRKTGIPALSIGPILLSPDTRNRPRAGKTNGITPEECRVWLDSKPVCSVLYISFGSQNTISIIQMKELAKALEASGKNFIWVVRPPLGIPINSEFKPDEWLPEGFQERIKASNKGLIVNNWAPQMEILSHKSTSVFLSHCGWNSLLEALTYGIPVLGWPVAVEQFYNVKFLDEVVGICVEIARGMECRVEGGDLMEKINLVMEETEKGKDMRKKSKKVMEIFQNAVKDEDGFKGSSVKAMDEFLDAALRMRKKTTKH